MTDNEVSKIMAKMRCTKCRHAWTPRTEKPLECPNCKNRKWQTTKQS